MNGETSLKGKNVAVIGFNARPIACSAKRAGANVYVSDYWGDADLADCSSEFVSVLSPEPGKRQRSELERPPHISLVENLLGRYLEKEFDHVIVGSGFDDRSDTLTPIEEQWGITGNSPELMRRARNVKRISKLADGLNIEYPARILANSPESILKAAGKIGFPCVVRPIRSGGGSDIALVHNDGQAESVYSRISESRMSSSLVVQQYISGIDISSSVMSSGDSAESISVQGQLIGVPSAGRNCDFVYCGNYCPHNLPTEMDGKIKEVSEAICTELGLLGSNGLDFVLDRKRRLWLLEINPRIQGTLEMIEKSKDVSISSLHVAAANGILSSALPRSRPAVKLVVFSRRPGKVPDLAVHESTVDRTPMGVLVAKGDPICTIIESRGSLEDCYEEASATARLIRRSIS